jgi:hypothetical protein
MTLIRAVLLGKPSVIAAKSWLVETIERGLRDAAGRRRRRRLIPAKRSDGHLQLRAGIKENRRNSEPACLLVFH